jgi:hypothetical protein
MAVVMMARASERMASRSPGSLPVRVVFPKVYEADEQTGFGPRNVCFWHLADIDADA